MRPLTSRLRLAPSGRAPGARPTVGAPLRARRGFSIVEAILAIMMLAIGVLAMVSSSTVVVHQLTASSQRTAAAALASERMERLRSNNLCASITTGSAVTWGMKESWTAAEVARNAGQRSMTVAYKVIYRKGRTFDTLAVTSNLSCD